MHCKRPDKLYHYTSVSNFALIIKNRTICFNSLANMDDPDGEIGKDYGNKTNIGKHMHASCWTDEYEESIPMWNQYAGGMHGVRICMPSFPFTTYHFDKGEFGSTYGGTFLFDYSQYYYEDKFIVPGDVALGSIEYTEVEEVLLGPKMDDGEKYLVDCMLKQIKFKGSVNESTLKVR